MRTIFVPLLVLTAVLFFIFLKPDTKPTSFNSKEKAEIPTSLEFNVRGVHVRLLNSGNLKEEKLKGLQGELEREITEILEFAKGDMPVVDVLTLDVITIEGYETKSVLYFDPALEAEEQFFYYYLTSNLFEQSTHRGYFNAAGLSAYFHDGPQFLHELYSERSDVEVASIEELSNNIGFVDQVYYGFTSYTDNDVEVANAAWVKIGSFTSYLIDQYSSSLYFKIYDSSDIASDFKIVYGKTMTEMEIEWREYLSSDFDLNY